MILKNNLFRIIHVPGDGRDAKLHTVAYRIGRFVTVTTIAEIIAMRNRSVALNVIQSAILNVQTVTNVFQNDGCAMVKMTAVITVMNKQHNVVKKHFKF